MKATSGITLNEEWSYNINQDSFYKYLNEKWIIRSSTVPGRNHSPSTHSPGKEFPSVAKGESLSYANAVYTYKVHSICFGLIFRIIYQTSSIPVLRTIKYIYDTK